MSATRPHVLGIDDGPFEKGVSPETPLVAVMMEGPDRVESVALGSFPVDGGEVTQYLASWIVELRCFPALQAVTLGGITIAGLAVVDILQLHELIQVPVLVVNRRDPERSSLDEALASAGFEDRRAIVRRTPSAQQLEDGLYLAAAGATVSQAEQLARAMINKAQVPEPLRIAHLIARAIVRGESRGRA